MYYITDYRFKYNDFNRTEITILIFIVKNMKSENYEMFNAMLSMIEYKSRKKIISELESINNYFKNIIHVENIEEKKQKLVDTLMNSNQNTSSNSVETCNLLELYNKHKDSFSKWLYDEKSNRYAMGTLKECRELFETGVENITQIKKEIINNKNLTARTNNGFRVFLNFLEDAGELSPILTRDMKSYIKGGVGEHVDNRVPSIDEITQSLKILREGYSYDDLVLYFVLLESGCRFEELKKFILEFDNNKIVDCDTFSYYNLSWRRGKKNSFYLFLSSQTLDHIKNNLHIYQSDTYLEKFRDRIQGNSEIENSKYIRKFMFTEMINTCKIDSDTANLFQGRISKGDIGQKHYLDIERILVSWYPKYLDFIEGLKNK